MLATTLLLLAVTIGASGNGTRYGFYRNAEAAGSAAGVGGAGVAGSSRRVFGGRSAPLQTWGAVCALLDRFWSTRCSGAVLTPRWALTAAHCVTPRIDYVKYNTRQPSGSEGDVQRVHTLYRHPQYKVVQEDEGRGEDVTLLHHDVGLVRTRDDMLLNIHPSQSPLVTMTLYDVANIRNDDVEVLGFGRTELSTLGEELFVTRLQLVSCERGAWIHCACGVGPRGGDAGVCAGDSGGPVLFRGVQVAVTSMGPMECAANRASVDADGTSVFTSLLQYAALINDTIHSTDSRLRMEQLSAAAPPAPALAPAVAALLLLLLQVAF